MKIVLSVPVEEPVPPKKYGGVELVAYNVLEHLVRMGHEVYLLGTGDSTTSAQLVPIVTKSIRATYDKNEIDVWRDYIKYSAIAEVLRQIRRIKPDIVHNHFAWRLLQFRDFVDCPMMSTVHGPLSSVHERTTYAAYADANYISISDNQRKAMPGLNWVATVYNGIEVDNFEVGVKEGRNYFVFLGRTSPEKGLKEICALIKQTNHQLIIAAKVDRVDEAYFSSEIKPFIDGVQIQFVGEVDHRAKVKLLKKAKALLLWLNWEEPFGLVVTEAMACGTPVIVNKRGSMAELVEDGKTGFLVDSLVQMKDSLELVDAIDPKACRARVEQHFSAEKMTRDYVRVAEQLLEKR